MTDDELDRDKLEPHEEDEALLPPKPPISDRLLTDAELKLEDEPGDEEMPDSEFFPPEMADLDDTVDDKEADD